MTVNCHPIAGPGLGPPSVTSLVQKKYFSKLIKKLQLFNNSPSVTRTLGH